MGHTLESYLIELFPEAKLITEGLDNGKWDIGDYLICFALNFYIVKSNMEGVLLNDNADWKKLLNHFKIEMNNKIQKQSDSEGKRVNT